MTSERPVLAGVILIGDELLSGRTQDSNLKTLAGVLTPLGIDVAEARIVPDAPATITATVRDFSARFDYVFTTGGIGPTHDDLTADAVAAAFDAPIAERADALAILEAHYAPTGTALTPARRHMARIPDGATLIANPVSGAPGFQIANVFVMAGVPKIMRAMLEDVVPRLRGGAATHSVSVRAPGLREGDVGEALSDFAASVPELSVGSYPWFEAGGGGVVLLARGKDRGSVIAAGAALERIARDFGARPEAPALSGGDSAEG